MRPDEGVLVMSQSAWNERLIYEGYSLLRNQWMGLPTNCFLEEVDVKQRS